MRTRTERKGTVRNITNRTDTGQPKGEGAPVGSKTRVLGKSGETRRTSDKESEGCAKLPPQLKIRLPKTH